MKSKKKTKVKRIKVDKNRFKKQAIAIVCLILIAAMMLTTFISALMVY